ncbi:MAG: hypothetical protein ACI8W7_001647 [Gammaproteobacteria bacterium]|jgi:hypothetical protein
MPKLRVNPTRFHGVFAPNSAHRAQVTPSKRGKGNKARTADAPEDITPAGHSRHRLCKNSEPIFPMAHTVTLFAIRRPRLQLISRQAAIWSSIWRLLQA